MGNLVRLMVAGIISVFLQYAAGIRCQHPWVSFGRNCYYFSSKKEVNFYVAMNACNSMGGHLLEIQNAREDNWIALQTNKRGYRYGVWLGFHDMHQEGNYVTLSSGGGKICYSNWHRGEPNNYGKSEHCATFRSTTRTWNDAHCKEIMNYVCKK
ncbi:perlucin-like protein [Crassostrea angulata]|uniref:perlucin-like protein n=1 Tax=Magallana angulata TaxID=2784310 RepID=UPI0022B096A9|nr:perlucin-like protein [Crassostrea angulata]